MQIGDRVKDKGTHFVGTIVQLDPPTGTAVRAKFTADDTKSKDRKVGDPPPASMWQKIEELELVDRSGNVVTGKAGAQLDATGTRLDTSGQPEGTGRVDGQGRRIDAQGGLVDNAGNRVDSAGNLLDSRVGSTAQPTLSNQPRTG
jgi:hypothetical protein